MGVKIDIASNRDMFFKAYDYLKAQHPNKFPTTTKKAAAIWFTEFSVIMNIDESGKFSEAEFASESDASVFILRWS